MHLLFDMIGPRPRCNKVVWSGGKRGLDVADQPVELQQSADGIRWVFTSRLPELDTNSDQDRSIWALRLRRHGVVFYSHPGHHGFPWAVAESVANTAIRQAISRLAFTFHKQLLAVALRPLVRCGVWTPSVTSISGSGMPPVKTCHTFGSMPMAFPTIRSGRATESPLSNSTYTMPVVRRTIVAGRYRRVTVAEKRWLPSFGTAPRRARAGVNSLVIGQENRLSGRRERVVLFGCVNRQAPVLPVRQRLRIYHLLPEDLETGVAVWKRLCFIMSSVCLAHLWNERNDAVFRGVQSTALHSAACFWALGIRHLTALAKREHRGPDTAVAGAIMHTCIDLFALKPRDGPISLGVSHDMLPVSELLSWLRSIQTSCA